MKQIRYTKTCKTRRHQPRKTKRLINIFSNFFVTKIKI